MRQFYLCLCVLLIGVNSITAQQTIGLFTNSDEALNGYTLFSPIDRTDIYLIDNCGEKVHSWLSAYQPGLSCYLMENGNLLRAGRYTEDEVRKGLVEIMNWDGNVIWSYDSFEEYGRSHHDVEMLPNGNILLIVYDEVTQEEVIQNGGSTTRETVLSEQIIEIEPNIQTGETNVVWIWKAWDHIIQEIDSTKNNYGEVSQHPEKVDLNYLSLDANDWLHFNAIGYNMEFDQIVLSPRSINELWIIDHSTTTEEAASSEGGTNGKGGDLLYRWGNPEAYQQGTEEDRMLFFQHNTNWINNDFIGGGQIIFYNNQSGIAEGEDYSTANSIEPPVDENGIYTYNGGAFGPSDYAWTYKANNPTDFYSSIISGAERLENGNTMICEGVPGRFFEVDIDGNIVWEYVNPMKNGGAMIQGDTVDNNSVFRCTRYAADYVGLEGRDLTPQGYLEIGSTFTCDIFTAFEEELQTSEIHIYPNPANSYINLQFNAPSDKKYWMSIYDVNGRNLYNELIIMVYGTYTLDVSNIRPGTYVMQIRSDLDIWNEIIVIAGKN